MTDFQIAAIGIALSALAAWLAWETRSRIQANKEQTTKVNEIATRVTVLETHDYLTYRQFTEELDKRLEPIKATLDAIAISESVKPDRRKH